MVICPNCNTLYPVEQAYCEICGFTPATLDGFEAWAPAFCKEANGQFFNPESFDELVDLEEDHFWFRARNDLILWAISKYCGEPISFAEIGCGTGFVLSAIANGFPNTALMGTEAFTEGLKFANKRIPKAKFVQLDARHLPYRDQFEVVGIFDVLEHIEEDEIVLREIHLALLPGGSLLLTVPQHRWLWSHIDAAACHVRRYTKDELHRKVRAAGFEIVRSTSFVSLLLPLMVLSRLTGKKKPKNLLAEYRIQPWLNRLLERILAVERRFIQAGLTFPSGGSRLVVAKKRVS